MCCFWKTTKINTISLYNSPKTWEELVGLKAKISSADSNFNRLDDDQSFYELYNKFVPKETRLKIIDQMIGHHDYKILKNNFPYLKLLENLPQVGHYCLWSRIGALSPEIIESEIVKKFPHHDFFWFENDPRGKSVPEVWHCHIFVKEK